jgi:DNA-binding GntR family transcriptional regulator
VSTRLSDQTDSHLYGQNGRLAAVSLPPATLGVDRASPVPLYHQLAQELERAIESGTLAVGARLDNEVALAHRLGLSRATVRRAIGSLVDQGLVVRKAGVGTRVVRPKVRRPLELTSLHDDLSASGRRPTTRVLVVELHKAPTAVAHALGLDDGATVLHLQRLRSADGEPLALMRNYLPAGVLELDDEDLERRGLYELMRGAGLHLHLAAQTIGARSATAAEARALSERRGAPLLTVYRVTYDADGRALELGDHLYRASRYSFEHVLSAR